MAKKNNLQVLLMQSTAMMGDPAANAETIINALKDHHQHIDLLVTPEMFLSGYPCDDLLYDRNFLDAIGHALDRIASATTKGGPSVIVGAPARSDGQLYNAAFVFEAGQCKNRVYKTFLPNYGVFDDKRHFTGGKNTQPVEIAGIKVGVMICEDVWFPAVAEGLKTNGAELLITLNASPFEANKLDERLNQCRARVQSTGLPLLYVNMVGGQDELVFDGSSFGLDAEGKIALSMPRFVEAVGVVALDIAVGAVTHVEGESQLIDGIEATYAALILSTRDYVESNGFHEVLVGLSGGIDSAIVAMLAVDALGPKRVRTVMMPTQYTSTMSLEDALQLSLNLGIEYKSIDICDALAKVEAMLAEPFGNRDRDVTEENLQSRMRGMILMALSNKTGALVLTTGNKSEYACGYATIYGDMCGGFAPIKDLWKTQVFDVCKWRNRHVPLISRYQHVGLIPQRIITRPPSAELSEDQKDTDRLPEYNILDSILMAHIEQHQTPEEIVAHGHDTDVVKRVLRLVRASEYKRFQSAPGPKITPRAFGRDRRVPITTR